MKKQRKKKRNLEITPNEMEKSNFPYKESKQRVIKMLNKLESRIMELREHFNKEIENVIQNQR